MSRTQILVLIEYTIECAILGKWVWPDVYLANMEMPNKNAVLGFLKVVRTREGLDQVRYHVNKYYRIDIFTGWRSSYANV